MTVQVQTADFDVAHEIAGLRAADAGIGAVVAFVGAVRDLNDAVPVVAMTLEHYPGMTEKALARIEAEARSRWDLCGVRIVHRVGELHPRDQIVLVAVTSVHRAEAFAACEFIIDHLKTQAPFWKKEETPSGVRWVDARTSDDEAARRWVRP